MENPMTFESWYKSITESVKENAEMAPTAPAPANPTTASQPTTGKAEISAEKSDIIKDVDSIMSQLAKLSVQVKEAHDIEVLEEVNLINESGAWAMSLSEDPIFQLISAGLLGVGAIATAIGFGAGAIKDYNRNKKIGALVEPDYDKLKELKLQEVKVQATIMQLKAKKAAISAIDGEEKEKIDAKKEELDAHIDQFNEKKDQLATTAEEFQSSLSDKYSEENLHGNFSGKVRTLIALKKSEVSADVTDYKLKVLGDTMPAETKKDLTQRMNAAKLEFKQNQLEYKKDIEENAKKVEDAKKKLPKEDQQKIEDVLNPKKKDKADSETSDNVAKDKEAPNKEEPVQTTNTENEPEKTEEPVQTTSTEDPKDTKLKNLKKLDQLLKQADEAGNETAIEKIKAKKKEVEAKESWQLSGTTLGALIESEITKIEMEMTLLNESKYSEISISDKFRMLMD
jgi:hypothetical protein